VASRKPRAPKVWADMTVDLDWGVQCDDQSLTFDGHFICIVPHDDPEKGHEIVRRLVDALEGRRPFRRTR